MDSDKDGHTLALGVLVTHHVTRCFRSHHEHVDPFGGNDLSVVDVEAVGENKGLARGQLGCDESLVDPRLDLVRNEDHHDISFLCGLRDRPYGETCPAGFLP